MSAWRSLALSCGIAIVLAFAPTPAAAQTNGAATIAAEWLGPRPDGAPVVAARGPIWQGSGAMTVEQRQAGRVIRSWFPESIADPKGAAIIDGFTSYLAALAVEREFDRRYLRIAHNVESRSYFGGHIIWSFPTLRISRHAAVGRNGYSAVFDSLERWIGAPALQAAMFEVARLPSERLTADSMVKTISDAAGQDLSWAFDAAASPVNYSVDELSDKSVTVSRHGSGMLSGRTAPRIGGFDSGDAVRIKAVFADGSVALAAWDGRDQTRTFAFDGPSQVVAAYLDPEGIVTLDRNRFDNSLVGPSETNVPVRKWAARWLVWLQHTMLSYGFLA
jgi:hypothetical protein